MVINDYCATEVDGIWAIGEVANFGGMCLGLVAPANTMAEIVADRLHGGEATFPGFDTATKLKLSGVDVASFGDAFAKTEHALEIVYADPARGVYQKIVTTDDAKTLLGGIFVGDATPYTSLRPLLGRELSAEPGAYLSAAGGGDAPDTELPDDAILCSCNNVSAGTIRDTVNGCGACDGNAPVQELGELKGCTRAGTSCGSCVPMLKKLLETELTKSGVEVSKALCEHIELSRQELFDAIRVLELTSFEEIMAKYGTGAGCDICKPTIANILASQNSAYVLDAGRGTLQDTNDRALANMQKDGTYSVVPRIAGGEITPKKLGVIAAVAEKYNLYTKITGGQRIDMFGARLEELPEIWKELVDAGFESGQAYGKSLRTVKSCVGSTWCRFGVQDSVAMAIQLELRYRGLRSPHKLKMGVSGCARECAEARGKDVGVIATADGWNLYVGGNGGATPAHAQLLAKDLDDETLIKYIDRYFMYYIRTADRLQRTARWQEELDGGIKHVEDVVVNDTLGIAEELEAAMAKHVDTYVDEWADTLKDPERLRRFRSFVNAPDQKDDSITFVPDERGQMRPATAEEKGKGPDRGFHPHEAPRRERGIGMQLSIDLTGREVLVTGSDHAARQAVRRYEAAGAVVYRLSTPQGAAHDGPLPERPFLVAAVDDGQPGWEALLERCRATGIPVAAEPASRPRRPRHARRWRPRNHRAADRRRRQGPARRRRRVLRPAGPLPGTALPDLGRTGGCGQEARPPQGQPGRHRKADGGERPRRKQRGPAQGRRSLRLRPRRRGSCLLRRSRRARPRHLRRHQRHLRSGSRRNPRHAPRSQPHVHGCFRPRPAD